MISADEWLQKECTSRGLSPLSSEKELLSLLRRCEENIVLQAEIIDELKNQIKLLKEINYVD